MSNVFNETHQKDAVRALDTAQSHSQYIRSALMCFNANQFLTLSNSSSEFNLKVFSKNINRLISAVEVAQDLLSVNLDVVSKLEMMDLKSSDSLYFSAVFKYSCDTSLKSTHATEVPLLKKSITNESGIPVSICFRILEESCRVVRLLNFITRTSKWRSLSSTDKDFLANTVFHRVKSSVENLGLMVSAIIDKYKGSSNLKPLSANWDNVKVALSYPYGQSARLEPGSDWARIYSKIIYNADLQVEDARIQPDSNSLNLQLHKDTPMSSSIKDFLVFLDSKNCKTIFKFMLKTSVLEDMLRNDVSVLKMYPLLESATFFRPDVMWIEVTGAVPDSYSVAEMAKDKDVLIESFINERYSKQLKSLTATYDSRIKEQKKADLKRLQDLIQSAPSLMEDPNIQQMLKSAQDSLT